MRTNAHPSTPTAVLQANAVLARQRTGGRLKHEELKASAKPPQSISSSVTSLLEIANMTDCAQRVIDDIFLRRLHTMRRCLVWLINHAPREIGNVIRDIYKSFAPKEQLLVLDSAEFCKLYVLIRSVTKELPVSTADGKLTRAHVAYLHTKLLELLLREHSLTQLQRNQVTSYLQYTSALRLWSPGGDKSARRGARGQWAITEQKRIGDDIYVDFDSDNAREVDFASGVCCDVPLLITAEERRNCILKLENAINMIDDVSQIHSYMIRNFIRTVVIRKSSRVQMCGVSGRRHVYPLGSESTPDQPGVIRISNLHLSNFSIPQCIETLIHETVHSVLTSWEIANGAFVESDARYRPISPWSGYYITNSALIHATFVYYMCYKFFLMLLRSPRIAKENTKSEVIRLLEGFAIGFLGPCKISELLIPTGRVCVGLKDVIDWLQNDVRVTFKLNSLIRNR